MNSVILGARGLYAVQTVLSKQKISPYCVALDCTLLWHTYKYRCKMYRYKCQKTYNPQVHMVKTM